MIAVRGKTKRQKCSGTLFHAESDSPNMQIMIEYLYPNIQRPKHPEAATYAVTSRYFAANDSCRSLLSLGTTITSVLRPRLVHTSESSTDISILVSRSETLCIPVRPHAATPPCFECMDRQPRRLEPRAPRQPPRQTLPSLSSSRPVQRRRLRLRSGRPSRPGGLVRCSFHHDASALFGELDRFALKFPASEVGYLGLVCKQIVSKDTRWEKPGRQVDTIC